MKYEKAAGMQVIIKRIGSMPVRSAVKLINGSITPIMPQLKPPITPDIMLLNSGMSLCAIDILTGTAKKLTKPIKTKAVKPIGHLR